jgi:hypothetical protein
LLALLAAQAAVPAPCPANEPCEVPLRFSTPALGRLLAGRDDAWWISGDILTIVARREGAAMLCCAVQRPLRPVGDGLQALAVRIPEIESAILDIMVIPTRAEPNLEPVWRGSRAPSAPPRSPLSEIATSFHPIDSTILGQRRGIIVYVPPGLPEGRRVPVVYASDGLMDNFTQIADAMIRRRDVAPFILVGIGPGSGPSACAANWCTARNREYMVDLPDPAVGRFDLQARFVIEEVIPFVETHYPALPRREARTVMGQSAGGAWALSRAPAARDAARLGNARLFLAAGRMEGNDRLLTGEAAGRARDAGAQVRLLLPNSGHSMGTWETAFAEALPWLFPPAREP